MRHSAFAKRPIMSQNNELFANKNASYLTTKTQVEIQQKSKLALLTKE